MVPPLELEVRRLPFPGGTGHTELRLDVPSDVAFVGEAVELISAHCQTGVLSPRRIRFNLRTALAEALTNAIVYGNRADPAKRVRVRVELGRDVVRIHVEDDGAGFDADAVPDPTTPDHLEREDGRGEELEGQDALGVPQCRAPRIGELSRQAVRDTGRGQLPADTAGPADRGDHHPLGERKGQLLLPELVPRELDPADGSQGPVDLPPLEEVVLQAHERERRGHRAPVGSIGVPDREERQVAPCRTRPDADDAIRIEKRQRSQKDGVHHCKGRRRRADPEREHEQGGRGEARVRAQPAHSMADVVEQHGRVRSHQLYQGVGAKSATFLLIAPPIRSVMGTGRPPPNRSLLLQHSPS